MRVKLSRSTSIFRSRAPHPRRGGLEPARRLVVAPPPVSAPAPAPVDHSRDRERCAGGPLDRALYICACGSPFQAAVSASVRCPHCGDTQAW